MKCHSGFVLGDDKMRFGVQGSKRMSVFMALLAAVWGFEPGFAAEEPVHSVQIKLCNPLGKQLFYEEQDNVIIDVLAPSKVVGQGLQVEGVLAKVNDDGTNGEVVAARGGGAFRREGDSLVWRVELGRQSGGVYAVSCRLLAEDGRVLGAHDAEPLIVLKRLNQKKIAGTSYLEGLELELEDTIDFTDPNDPHPSLEGRVAEGKPVAEVTALRIVRKNGLAYREITGDKRGSYISYRLEFRHPGDFYLLEVEYPDDDARSMIVSISTKRPGVWTNSQTGVGVETGGKFYNTGESQKLRWIHVADPGVHSVDIMNIWDGWNGAVTRMNVYHIRGDLPAVDAGTSRDYGILTERCSSGSGFANAFGAMRSNAEGADPKQKVLSELVWLVKTSECYAQYLKFSGQNLHVMGCVQYTLRNTPFIAADPNSDSPSIIVCPRTVLAHVLDANGIGVMAGIEFTTPPAPEAKTKTAAGSRLGTPLVSNEEVAAGKDTIWRVDAQGEQRTGIFTWPPNWQHPVFQREYLKVMDDIVNTFGHLEHFRGVSNVISPIGHPSSYFFPAYADGMRAWDPGPSPFENPLQYSYDDVTFKKFAKDTAIDLGIDPDDPTRFAKRAAMVAREPLRQSFLDWRCRSLREFFDEVLSHVRKSRRDLLFVNGLFEESSPPYLAHSGKSYEQVMREFGIDIPMLASLDNMVMMRWTISWRGGLPQKPQNPYWWIPKERGIVLSAFDDLPHRAIMCRSSWDENFFASPGYPYARPNPRGPESKVVESDWIFGAVRTRGHVQPSGHSAREAFTQAIITGDPELLLGGFADLSLNLGNEQVIREVLVPFTHLPQKRFDKVLDTGLETNLAIRQLNQKGESWFYIANPGYWRIRGEINLSVGGDVQEIPSGRQVAEAGQFVLPVELAPFGLAAYQVNSGSLNITSYTTRSISPRAASHLKSLIKLAFEKNEFLDQAQKRLLGEAQTAVAAGKYARAWSLIKDHRLWPVNGWNLMTKDQRRGWPVE